MSSRRWGGGRYVVEDEEPKYTMTPEDFTVEQRALSQITQSFVEVELGLHGGEKEWSD